MAETRLNFDRYHATMANFAFSQTIMEDGSFIRLADKHAVFYLSQRKIPFAPCVGHDRLLSAIANYGGLDESRLDFLRQDKAGLKRVADALSGNLDPFEIRCVKPGTIIFAKEPFADINGPFGLTQMLEVEFQHAFDEPITVAGRALEMRMEAGERWLSDFSLRRDGSAERACEIAKYAFIGGFDDTSNMEAAFLYDLNPVGTMAHYLVQAFYAETQKDAKTESKTVNKKHFEQIAFEQWLDAHPSGTTLLLDTISVTSGTIHAIAAAKSSTLRRQAIKAVRIDSGNLPKNAWWVRKMLDANELPDVKIIVTSDLDALAIREIIKMCPSVYGFGVGTKLAAEVENVAGVIFKLCEIGGHPTLKCSDTLGKETLPGKMQVWRYVDKEDFYIKDIISCLDEPEPQVEYASHVFPLLSGFFSETSLISPRQQKEYVKEQMTRFRNIKNYPVEISKKLAALRSLISTSMRFDFSPADVVIV